MSSETPGARQRPIIRILSIVIVMALAGCTGAPKATSVTPTVSKPLADDTIVSVAFSPSPEPTPVASATPMPTVAPANTALPTETPTYPPTPSPVPTATATLTPSIAPTATTAPTQLTATPVALSEPAVVGIQAANLRSGPGTVYGIVGLITPDDRYKIVGKNADSSWWQIEQADGQPAWVLARLVNPEGALDDIQVVENIPTPPPQAAPAGFGYGLRAVYQAVKLACPSMLVVSGAPSPTGAPMPMAMNDLDYLREMYANGLASASDAVGVSLPGYNLAPDAPAETPQFRSFSFHDTLQSYLNLHAQNGGPKLWVTQFGWGVGPVADKPYAFANDNTAEEQANWSVRACETLRGAGAVGATFLWNLDGAPSNPDSPLAMWSIVNYDWSPRPAYTALQQMAR